MAPVFCCEVCDDPKPQWRLDRRGDAVVSWACDGHLSVVCHRLQRYWEITEIVVSSSAKRREWAAITKTLDQVADGTTR